MPVSTPYKLQIFLPEDVREALKGIAKRKNVSLQQLVCAYLIHAVSSTPEGEHIVTDAIEEALVTYP